MRVVTYAPNQIVVHTVGESTFFSYDTRIATHDHATDATTLTASWDYSATTLRYLGRFLGVAGTGSKARIKAGIASGEYGME